MRKPGNEVKMHECGSLSVSQRICNSSYVDMEYSKENYVAKLSVMEDVGLPFMF